MSTKDVLKTLAGAFLFSFMPSVLDASCTTVQNTIRISTVTCCNSSNQCYSCVWDNTTLVVCHSE